jgi:hypothetical protein
MGNCDCCALFHAEAFGSSTGSDPLTMDARTATLSCAIAVCTRRSTRHIAVTLTDQNLDDVVFITLTSYSHVRGD